MCEELIMDEFKVKYKKEEDETIKVLLKSSKATNCCCSDEELVIVYDWSGTDLADLDTSTSANWASGLESHGFDCSNEEKYMKWIGGDFTGLNGSETVNVKIATAKSANEWSSSLNVNLHAWWYPKYDEDEPTTQGGGYVKVTASYGNQSVNLTMNVSSRRTTQNDGDTENNENCCPTPFAIVTVGDNGGGNFVISITSA